MVKAQRSAPARRRTARSWSTLAFETPNAGDLALGERAVHRLQRLLEWRHCLELVDVVEVDPADLQASQRLVEVKCDLRRRQRMFAGWATVGIADLGRDLDRAAIRRTLRREPVAQHRLAHSAAVGVGGVEAGEPDVAGVIQQGEGAITVVALVAQRRRGAETAEVATAEDDASPIERDVHRAAKNPGLPPLRIVVSMAASMLPPETMQTIRPVPAPPDTAAATDAAPAPSTMT